MRLPGPRRDYERSIRKRRRRILNRYKVWKGCKDCGYKKDSRALTFDHRDPSQKLFSVGQSFRKWSKVKAEVRKCDVRCWNCHMIKTVQKKEGIYGKGKELKKTVYIVGPITKGDRVNNFSQSIVAFREVVDLGLAPFNPMTSMLTEFMTPMNHDGWLSIDLPWVAKADYLLRLPGESVGADKEVQTALDYGVCVVYSTEELKACLLKGGG